MSCVIEQSASAPGLRPTPMPAAAAELESVRDEIDRLDRELVNSLSRRVELARRAASLKTWLRRPLLDHRREAAVLRNASAEARRAALDEERVRQIYWCILALCRAGQVDAR